MRYQVNRRRFLRDSTLATIGLVAAACAPSTTAPSGSGPVGAKKGGEFHGGWPYELPPKGHYNYFAAGAIIGDSVYRDLFQPGLALYRWNDARWEYLTAESHKLTGDSFDIKLRSGIKWSDGASFTSKDVATTFWIFRLQSASVWTFIDKIETPDDLTVKIHVSRPTSLIERLVLRNFIRPDSVYGALAKKTQDLVAANKKSSDDEWKAVAKELSDLRPTNFPSSGPYKIDYSSVTEAQMSLTRNKGGLREDVVNFDKILIYQGETAQVTPLVLAGDIDYATHGFPVATDKAFADQGLRVIRGPLYTGPAIYFHWEKAPQFQDKRLRQAVAMAINRVESGKIAYGDSGKPPKFMAGYSDALLPNWVSADDQKKLNSYAFDVAKADALMKEAGYAKGSDGIYAKDGKRLEFELYFPSDFADWSSAATHATDALNKFGIKITPKGALRAQQSSDFNKGDFTIALNAWGIGHPHPQQSLQRPIREFNVSAAGGGGGMKYPVKQRTSFGEVDFADLLDKAVDGYDQAKQKDPVTKLTLAFNELLPCIPLWERFNNNPVNDKKRVTGWKPEGDPVYNQGGGDPFSVLMILDGTLRSI